MTNSAESKFSRWFEAQFGKKPGGSQNNIEDEWRYMERPKEG